MKKLLVLGVSAIAAFSVFAQVYTWVGPTAANAPATAYDWDDANNWTNAAGQAEAPVDGNGVKFPAFSASRVYVRLPARNVTVSSFSSASSPASNQDGRLALIGEGSLTLTAGTLGGSDYSWIFSEFVNGKSGGSDVYTAGVNLAGPVKDEAKDLVSSWNYSKFRYDRFATSAESQREFRFARQFHPGSGHNSFYSPESSATNMTSVWTTTAGSPFIVRTAAAPHALPVGTLVTGPGVPEGTYLKRYFTKSSLELSAPVTASGENALTFAAFTPDVRVFIGTHIRQGTTTTYFDLNKYRPEDTLRVEMNSFLVYNGETSVLGLASDSTYYPGTYVFHTIGEVTHANAIHELRNCDMELAGNAQGVTEFPVLNIVRFSGSAYTANVTVTNGITGGIGNLTNFVGTLVKKGVGRLNVGLAEAVSTGTLRIEGGSVQVSGRPTAGASVTIDALEMSAGTKLVLPEGFTLAVRRADISADATIAGPGTLRIFDPVGTVGAIATENGAKIEYSFTDVYEQIGPLEGEVVGHPAFWLDASQKDTVEYTTENGVNYVTRWNDCREGEPMFCTNLVRRPTLVWGETMKEKYVKLTQVYPCDYITNTETLVWSVPLRDIRAVFLVEDPADGGGQILGRCSWRLGNSNYGSRGGPFYRENISNWASALVQPGSNATDPVRYGRFYLDGEEVDGDAQGFYQSGVTVLEFHSNTNWPAARNGSVWGIAADNFGCSYEDVHDGGNWIGNHNGCMRICEYVIYTNSLTQVERMKVAQYLSKKWLGKSLKVMNNPVACTSVGGTDVTISVGSDGHGAIGEVSGPGTVEKTGDGTLVFEGARTANLVAAAGRTYVRSLSFRTADDLPLFTTDEPWLCLDADDASSFVTRTANGTNYVTRWNDCRGTDYYARRHCDGDESRDSWIREQASNGRRMVDTGPALKQDDGGRCLMFYDAKTGLWPGATRSTDERNGVNAPKIRTAFIFYGSENGGGAVLGSYYGSHPQYGFPHDPAGGPATALDFACPIITNYEHAWGWTDMRSQSNNKSIDFRLNGVRFDPFKEPFSGGFDLMTFDGKNNCTRQTVTLAAQAYGSWFGGLSYGDVILSSNRYVKTEIEMIEKYLLAKWRGEAVPGYSTATFDSLTVADGATVTAYGKGGFTAKALAGAGTVEADVAFAENGAFDVTVDESGVPSCGLVVDGALTLPEMATVNIGGFVKKLESGTYTLLTAKSIVGSVGAWTVVSARKGQGYALNLVHDEATGTDRVDLSVAGPGFMVIVR